MTARPRHRIGVTASVVLLTLLAGVAPGAADQIGDKQAEAAAIASKLDDQAQQIVSLDVQYRKAQDQVDDAQAGIAQAETEMAAATRHQDDLKRILATQALDAYVVGGSVSVLQYLVRSNESDEVVRRAYLRIVTGQDRQVIDQLKASREDLAALRDRLQAAQRKAKAEADALASSRDDLDRAIRSQRSVLAEVNGEIASLVAAEQARRDAESAAQAAAATPVTAALAAAPVGATAQPAATAAPARASGGSSLLNDTFACIRELESGDNYGSAGGGAYQFLDSTWHALGYSGTASDASPATQDEAAQKLQAESGWSPWTTAPLCGRP
jgi:peptidoglycan hydrolase CwlO-like protein